MLPCIHSLRPHCYTVTRSISRETLATSTAAGPTGASEGPACLSDILQESFALSWLRSGMTHCCHYCTWRTLCSRFLVPLGPCSPPEPADRPRCDCHPAWNLMALAQPRCQLDFLTRLRALEAAAQQ
jgi:hypothetical protein